MASQTIAGHPDQGFAHYILAGLQQGFRIGFNHGSASLRQGEGNMKCDNPQAVADYLQAELEANRLSRLSRSEASTIGVHFSPVGEARQMEADSEPVGAKWRQR